VLKRVGFARKKQKGINSIMKKKTTPQRFLAIALSLLMVISLAPMLSLSTSAIPTNVTKRKGILRHARQDGVLLRQVQESIQRV